MRSLPILPLPLRPVQPDTKAVLKRPLTLIRAAVDLTPHPPQAIVGLTDHSLNAWEARVVRQIESLVDRLVLETNPAVRACRRIGLPANYLYVDENADANFSPHRKNPP